MSAGGNKEPVKGAAPPQPQPQAQQHQQQEEEHKPHKPSASLKNRVNKWLTVCETAEEEKKAQRRKAAAAAASKGSDPQQRRLLQLDPSLGQFNFLKHRPSCLLGSVSVGEDAQAEKAAGAVNYIDSSKQMGGIKPKTGFAYHQSCCAHANFNNDREPERPSRVYTTHAHLAACGFFDGELYPNVSNVPVTAAKTVDLERIHTDDHINFVDSVGMVPQMLDVASTTVGQDLYASKGTSKAARLAAGGVINAAKSVVEGENRNAFCLVRPPGHHCSCTRPSGFCFFNNVAVAAKTISENYEEDEEHDDNDKDHGNGGGKRKKKILIIDWDVHHGDGTQSIFYNDRNVLFFSVHQHGFKPKPSVRYTDEAILQRREQERNRKEKEREAVFGGGTVWGREKIDAAQQQQQQMETAAAVDDDNREVVAEDEMLALLSSASGSQATKKNEADEDDVEDEDEENPEESEGASANEEEVEEDEESADADDDSEEEGHERPRRGNRQPVDYAALSLEMFGEEGKQAPPRAPPAQLATNATIKKEEQKAEAALPQEREETGGGGVRGGRRTRNVISYKELDEKLKQEEQQQQQQQRSGNKAAADGEGAAQHQPLKQDEKELDKAAENFFLPLVCHAKKLQETKKSKKRKRKDKKKKRKRQEDEEDDEDGEFQDDSQGAQEDVWSSVCTETGGDEDEQSNSQNWGWESSEGDSSSDEDDSSASDDDDDDGSGTEKASGGKNNQDNEWNNFPDFPKQQSGGGGYHHSHRWFGQHQHHYTHGNPSSGFYQDQFIGATNAQEEGKEDGHHQHSPRELKRRMRRQYREAIVSHKMVAVPRKNHKEGEDDREAEGGRLPPPPPSLEHQFIDVYNSEDMKSWDSEEDTAFYPNTGHRFCVGGDGRENWRRGEDLGEYDEEPHKKDGEVETFSKREEEEAAEDARGKNVNVPWPTTGFGDLEYLYVLHELLVPMAREFQPDLVFISCGFDCAQNDLLGEMNVSPSGFYAMTRMVCSLISPNVVVVLEGGYNIKSVALSSESVLRALLEDTHQERSSSEGIEGGAGQHPSTTATNNTTGSAPGGATTTVPARGTGTGAPISNAVLELLKKGGADNVIDTLMGGGGEKNMKEAEEEDATGQCEDDGLVRKKKRREELEAQLQHPHQHRDRRTIDRTLMTQCKETIEKVKECHRPYWKCFQQ